MIKYLQDSHVLSVCVVLHSKHLIFFFDVFVILNALLYSGNTSEGLAHELSQISWILERLLFVFRGEKGTLVDDSTLHFVMIVPYNNHPGHTHTSKCDLA